MFWGCEVLCCRRSKALQVRDLPLGGSSLLLFLNCSADFILHLVADRSRPISYDEQIAENTVHITKVLVLP
jgi:hypothetical protein